MPNFGVSLELALSLSAACGPLGSLDSDAAAWIAAVEIAKGSAVSGAQQAIIDSRVREAKTAGFWDSIKRLYFPIWANAAANAIDIKTLATLTWINSPTMGAGYVQGNGSTQCARDASNPTALGLASTSGALFALILQADSRTDARYFLGARTNNSPADGECSLYQINTSQINSIIGRVPSTPVGFVSGVARTGIFHTNRNPSQGIIVSRRGSGGVTRGGADAGTSAVTSAQPFNYMALRDGNFDSSHTDARLGAFGVGTGLANNTEVDAFTLWLQGFWQDLTSLTLPA